MHEVLQMHGNDSLKGDDYSFAVGTCRACLVVMIQHGFDSKCFRDAVAFIRRP